MPLKSITRDFLAMVEHETGYSAQLLEEPKLPALSRLQLANKSAPAHRITYRPSADDSADYAICYQCGFALRLFDNPPDARYQYAPSEKGQAAVRMLITDGGKSKRAGASQVEELASGFLRDLVEHLRTVPVGLRVAEWLLESYPGLEAGQRSAVAQEVAEAQATLQPEVREGMPARIFDAMQGLNAAQAIYWAEQHGNRELAAPFREAGYQRAGRALLDIWRNTSSEPGQDRELVNRWADELRVSGWGSWQRYVAP